MPNCDFYASRSDLSEVVHRLFEYGTCRVFESYSRSDQPLREFRSPQEIEELEAFGRCSGAGQSILLQLWVTEASEAVRTRRVSLNPQTTGASFRHVLEGWGLIQLYLGGESERGIVHSHTNHGSRARALNWQATRLELGSPDAWDWRQVTNFSSRLNRFIRSREVSRVGSRPVLQGAKRKIEDGVRAL